MREKKIQAVLFDMDGLMFDTEVLYMKAWKKAGEKLGIPIDDRFLLPSRGMIRADSKKLFEELYHPSIEYESIIAIRQEFLEKEFEKGILCKKGLFPLLNYLKTEGYQIALATSTPRERAIRLLQKTKVESFFDDMVFGDMVEHGKPEPDIFIKAAGKIGIDPKHCLVLEDSRNGIVAGKRAGCRVVMIPDLIPANREIMEIIDAKLDDLEKAIIWIQEINNEINTKDVVSSKEAK